MALDKTAVLNATCKYAELQASGSALSGVSRQAITWEDSGSDSAADATLEFTGGTADASVDAVALFSAATGGTNYGSVTLTGDSTLNAEGKYNVTSLKITG